MGIAEYFNSKKEQLDIVQDVLSEFNVLITIRDDLKNDGYNVEDVNNIIEAVQESLRENGIDVH